jgi:hypothetical protein
MGSGTGLDALENRKCLGLAANWTTVSQFSSLLHIYRITYDKHTLVHTDHLLLGNTCAVNQTDNAFLLQISILNG